MIRLKLISGPQKGREYSIAQSRAAVLGRQCKDILIPDMMASRQHAQLIYQNGCWLINDLDSSNGTFVNKIQIDSFAELEAGDTLRIGETDLQIISIEDDIVSATDDDSLPVTRSDQPTVPSSTERPDDPIARPQPLTKDQMVQKQLEQSAQTPQNYVRPHVHIESPIESDADDEHSFSEEAMNEQTIAGTVYDPSQVVEDWDEDNDNSTDEEGLLEAHLNEADQMAIEINELLMPLPSDSNMTSRTYDTDRKPGKIKRLSISLIVLACLGGIGFLAYENYLLKQRMTKQENVSITPLIKNASNAPAPVPVKTEPIEAITVAPEPAKPTPEKTSEIKPEKLPIIPAAAITETITVIPVEPKVQIKPTESAKIEINKSPEKPTISKPTKETKPTKEESPFVEDESTKVVEVVDEVAEDISTEKTAKPSPTPVDPPKSDIDQQEQTEAKSEPTSEQEVKPESSDLKPSGKTKS
ncbi:FHA domain-containing protein [Planctomycetota bacterium]|nr:FHA domain-containing protein [Planctomycetota bacterium]